MLRSVAGKIAILVTPMLIIFGVLYMVYSGSGSLRLPSWDVFYASLNTLPDGTGVIYELRQAMDFDVGDVFNVGSWTEFWEFLTSFHSHLVSFVINFFRLIALPFQYIWWLFNNEMFA